MINFETEYTDPSQVQDLLDHIVLWARDAAAYREAVGERAHVDVAYGESPRQRLDIFAPASGVDGPIALFLHGGYWQSMDKSSFSHMARGPNEHGVTVAVAGYTLCPAVRLSEIVEEIRQAVRFIAKRFDRPVTVYGHSAGGHLTACMLATNWQDVDPSLAVDTVPAGLSVSGLFELEPLVSTSVNAKLRLDASEARRLSPLFWQAPAGRTMIAYVGRNESSEYLRQTRSLVSRWRASGVEAIGVEVAGATHFTVLGPLADPASAMTGDVVRLAKAGRT